MALPHSKSIAGGGMQVQLAWNGNTHNQSLSFHSAVYLFDITAKI